MATAETDTKTALQELLDERQRYEGWLRALDDRRAATPPHVYERVRTDYTLRLERVTQRLRERAEQLTATIEGMRTRLQSLRSREADRTDERHEFELRAAVGELSPEEWERRRGEADRELTAIAEDRRSVEGELAELDRIVALTREPATRAPQAPTVAEPAETAEAAATSSAGFEPEEESIAPDMPAASATAGAVDRGEHHPLAAAPDSAAPSIDDFVADWPVRQMARPEAAEHTEGAAESGASPATATWHPPAAGTGGGSAAAGLASMAGTGGIADAAPSALHSPDRPHDHDQPRPGMAGDGRRDADKTLKCPECGAMNYATEWYCERCGGELASF